MSIPIRFYANPRDKDEYILERLVQIVVGTKRFTDRGEDYSGSRWVLGTSNNWFVSKDPQIGEFVLDYRYSTEERMNALRAVIIWLLDLQSFNEEQE